MEPRINVFNPVSFTNIANLGANAILGVSMAVCRAGAAQKVYHRFIKLTPGRPIVRTHCGSRRLKKR